jgi:hypothetical protein
MNRQFTSESDTAPESGAYVVLPAGPFMSQTTQMMTGNTPVLEFAAEYFNEALLSSLLVFFCWVGAWGAVDGLVQMTSDNPLVQIGRFLSTPSSSLQAFTS